jgi:hypothetical protein
VTRSANLDAALMEITTRGMQDYIGSDLMQRTPHEKAGTWGAFELGAGGDSE